ncbi:alkaline phosphatase D family protein [Neolewinella litorea]|uniref:Alkaline phosphatase family protein n=1 Tax=Neolewinella litorea TaxID=2562452 RepID=A0A4S4NJM6_9BACT|nr:alkaline phosphatase D family protein [Neolewinella litorea]THH40016.1 alkaline phosphatase family protein [Neolewinella litorea]
MRYLLLLLPLWVFGQEADLQSGPMLGYSEQREVLIWVQTTGPAEVTVAYWAEGEADPSFTSTIQTAAATAYTAKLVADQVSPGTTYEYYVMLNGEVVSLPYPTRFTTQPTWGWRSEPPDFTVALGSCTYVNEPRYDRPGPGYGSEYEIFETIDSLHPDLMIWLGDNMYLREPDWYTRTGYFHRYTHTRSLPEMQPLLARTFHYATWDDHDYGPNDSDGSWIRKKLAKETFDLFWGNLTSGLPGNGGITSTFRYVDTDFFLLDNRSFRTPNGMLRETGKTLLGETQLEWLIQSLIFSDSPWKMVCIGGQVLNTYRGAETYNGLAPEEREYLLRRITEENISGVVFLTGDRHHTVLSSLELPNGNRIYDLTISSLTAGTGSSRDEENALRVAGTLLVEHNFGVLTFSGPLSERELAVRVYGTDGVLRWERVLER